MKASNRKPLEIGYEIETIPYKSLAALLARSIDQTTSSPKSLLELANQQPRHIAWYRADVPVTLG